ncbi:MAG TPA: DnaA/Hda family protein [Solirubrobacterales bacterium]|nr:DnaA/Hda family protein [Solirubrobacterales bacterium]
MPDAPKQLALDLPLEPRFGREDFLVSPSNERAYGLIERWPDWPDTVLLLEGPKGSGKSHLAAIWATEAHGWTVDAFEVTMERVPHLISNGALVIEDLDQGGSLAGADEPALFHLLNLARERGAYVVLTTSAPVAELHIRTPDLKSRLRLAPSVSLDPPDDALLRAVLVKLFVDRQLVVDTTVVDFLALRIERSLAAAAEVVTALDREALSRGRRITRPMAAELLGRAAGTEEE